MPINLTRTEWSIAVTCVVSLIAGFFLGFISSEHTYPVPIRVPAYAPSPQLPHCEEDEVFLRGQGDYDGATGQWTDYVCVHPDNMEAVEVICTQLPWFKENTVVVFWKNVDKGCEA